MTQFFTTPFVARLDGKAFCGKACAWLDTSISILHG
jgi:hypothetical protein